MTKCGKLYGVGVGPGAPDLLTLRAVNILGSVDVILAAASPRNTYSTALDIAKPHINAKAQIERLDFPMTHDKETLREAWHKAATRTMEILSTGKDAAFLTLGDPLIYSTFGYLAQTIKQHNDDIEFEVISGITSFQAAAARTGTVLCEGHENLLILPGINGGDKLSKGLDSSDNTVILKAYKNFTAICEALEGADRMQNALLASYVCQEGESIYPDLTSIEGVPPYLSLIISKK